LERRQTEKGHKETSQSEGNILIHMGVWVTKMNHLLKVAEVQLLWKTVCRFLKKLKPELFYII